MRSTCARILVGAAILAGARIASAQTADDIVEKTLSAQGGREAFAKVTSRSMSGTMVVSTPGGDLPGTVEVLNQAPNKVRTLVTLDLTAVGAGSMTLDQRFDGTKAFAMDSMRGDTEVTGSMLDNMKNNAFPTPLLNYKDRGVKAALDGKKDKVGEREAYVLTFTPPTGPASRVWIDADSYLPLKTSVTVDAPETGPLEQIVEFADFRDVDGIKVPFQLKNTNAMQTFTVTMTKIEHNVKIDPALFVKPDSK
jgi:outer membrane lipoprotein-sorting protein